VSHGTTQDRTPLISVALNGVWGPQVIYMARTGDFYTTRGEKMPIRFGDDLKPAELKPPNPSLAALNEI